MSEEILVIGPAWIGDMVMAQSLFKLIKQRRPQTQIDVVAPAWTMSLLAHMPEVRESIPLPTAHGQLAMASRWRLGRRLRDRRYQQAIVLPNSFKSALIPVFAAARRRTGLLGEYRWGLLNDIRQIDRQRLPRRVDSYVALALEAGEPMPAEIPYPSLAVSPSDANTTLEKFSLTQPDGPVLGICPGAEFGPTKQWPASYYAQVANNKLEQGWQVWMFGSDRDALVTKEIQSLTDGRCLSLAGRTSLTESIELMSLLTLVITNDSGLMHVAASLDKDLVAIYGSTDPKYNPPLHARAQILYLDLDCSPCYKRTCPLKHSNCLRQLKPTQVLERINS